MAKAPVKAVPSTAPLYRLTRRYWDGFQTFEEGTLIRFEEGTAPSSAVRVSEQELVELPPPVPVAGADDGDSDD